jgi:DNA-binding HxlR family transcriptional regulator
VSYGLTDKGIALQGVIDQVEHWAHDWIMSQDPGKSA